MEYTKLITCNDGSRVLAFQGGHCFLASHHRTPFKRLGQRYWSVHQYVLAHKAMLYEDEAALEEILNAKTVKEQADAGRKIKGTVSKEKWEKEEEKHTRIGVIEKLRQHPRIMEALVKTEDCAIANCTAFDSVYGTGLRIECAEMKDKSAWGENRLGRMYDELRLSGLP